MRRADSYFVILYVTLTSALSLTLFLLKEARVDAYVATNILVYYTCYTVVRPSLGKSLPVRIYNALLLLVIGVIVALRVYEVLGF